MFYQLQSERTDLIGKIFNYTLEGVYYVFKIVAVQKLKVDCQNVLQQRLNHVFCNFVLQDYVECDCPLDPHQRVSILGQTCVDPLNCHLDYIQIQLQSSILSEYVNSSGPQKHDLVIELRNNILRYQRGKDTSDLFAPRNRCPQLTNQIHCKFLFNGVAISFQFALDVVHILEEEVSRFIVMWFFIQFTTQFSKSHPYISCHSF